MTAKIDRTVVRNTSYQKQGIGIRERHNERKNQSYRNPDIVPERSNLNVHFQDCASTYVIKLEQMLEQGEISARGLKENAKVFGELVFDVNTAYFEKHGGYDYAKEFFEEAYRFAQKEIGAPYILSAVMHADEQNVSLSEELGYDVYHYHLHVVYIPVVDKEIKWSKRCRDKSLVGTTKEVIHQISNSKKWAFVPAKDEQGNPIFKKDGKPKLVPSYSLLQDRFFEHMQAAGYTDFERGVRGSTTEHLSVIAYKVQQDKEKLAALEQKIQNEQEQLADLQTQRGKAEEVSMTVQQLEQTGKKKLFGRVEMTEQEFSNLTKLAREGIESRYTIANLKRQLSSVKEDLYQARVRLNELMEQTKDFFRAFKLAPERVKELLQDIFQRDKEEKEQKRLQLFERRIAQKKSRKKDHSMTR